MVVLFCIAITAITIKCKNGEQKDSDRSVQSDMKLEHFLTKYEFKNKKTEIELLRKWSTTCTEKIEYDPCMISRISEWVRQRANLKTPDVSWIEAHPNNIYTYLSLVSAGVESRLSPDEIRHVVHNWIEQEKREE